MGHSFFCCSRQSGSSPVPVCHGDPALSKPAAGDAASPQGKGGERGLALAGCCLSSLLFLRVCSSTYSSQPTGGRLLERWERGCHPTGPLPCPWLCPGVPGPAASALTSPRRRIWFPHWLRGDVPAQRRGEASLTPVKHPMPFVPPGLPVVYKGLDD